MSLKILKNQKTSRKNVDFWLLLKNQNIWLHWAQIQIWQQLARAGCGCPLWIGRVNFCLPQSPPLPIATYAWSPLCYPSDPSRHLKL